jgi:hypothetical protein
MTYVRDWKKIDDLLIAGCNGTEIAGYLGINQDTLYRWALEDKNMTFADYQAEKRSRGDSLLKAQQFAKAMGLTDKGDNTLLIWLGKCRLKQKEEEHNRPSQIILKVTNDGLGAGVSVSTEELPTPPDKSAQ